MSRTKKLQLPERGGGAAVVTIRVEEEATVNGRERRTVFEVTADLHPDVVVRIMRDVRASVNQEAVAAE